MIYLLDTNTISDIMIRRPEVNQRLIERKARGDILGLCRPVYYEVIRGLMLRKATAKLVRFREEIVPLFSSISLIEEDWLQAAIFWADTKSQGKQLSDIDLLLAAMAYRRDAVLATSDLDFNVLPVRRENWRESQP